MSGHARFEYASIGWSTMEGLQTPAQWQRWQDTKLWCDLPRAQEMRHRCMDGIVYMGNGMASYIYSYILRENVDIMPGWSLCFGCKISLKTDMQKDCFLRGIQAKYLHTYKYIDRYRDVYK